MTDCVNNAELDDYLDLARAGPALSDEQHIYHKLIFDAVNEAINKCIVDVGRHLNVTSWSMLDFAPALRTTLHFVH